ncbi:MAG: preprotein translocase subunit SecA [Candidatus Peribacteraceae bacterium]|jgi:preprotein translocase subunit SecA|nr:preprotein translocase subunit SecA [Candidatus Peribacteraceae bacterium]
MSIIDLLNKLLGDPNVRELKRLAPVVKRVKEAQKLQEIIDLKLEDVPKKTEEFRDRVRVRIRDGEDVKKVLNDLLPEAFAVVVKTCELIKGKRVKLGKQEFVWDMVPYDVQILGGAVLHQGNITEMKTGEGKTLVCTMSIYLNALTGKGVHVVTVNDYLAKRDALWMGMLYEALGLTVGTVLHEKNHEERQEAYGCDITYGTNNEYGFDYLRDNMATSVERQVQRGLNFAIVDEVDSILVDEARTPLIISQPADESTSKYIQYSTLVGQLKENTHYNKDEKQKTAALTEEGIKQMEQLLGIDNIYTEKGFEEVHHIEQALRAHAMYEKDVDYVVKDNEVIIVDEFTGRLMPGRRYGHGLHQAVEAKEKVEVQRESKTLATITFQNYFRLYNKLAGMTGTAKTEAEEFESIYKLTTIVVPTNKPLIRNDRPDSIYRTVEAKFKAVAKIAKEKHEKGQPVLVGTTSIEKSEALAKLLESEGVPHSVLNAKHHEKEADIVALAGQKGAITIATNMAGRGTDIKLEEGVTDLGGLCILGTERHEARRIDNQLRGRAGRQGDPGESVFFVSMEDDLMRLFGGDRLKSMMEKLKVPDDVPLENKIVSRSIESAQKKVEGRNFDIRRHVVQYDDVMNRHREIIYVRRQKILDKIFEEETKEIKETKEVSTLHDDILNALEGEANAIVDVHALENDSENWEIKKISGKLDALHPQLNEFLPEDKIKEITDREELRTTIKDLLLKYYETKCKEFEPVAVSQAERVVTLRSIDTHWMDHIDEMSHLREQVAFSGYAQRDPLIEYKDQGFRKFEQLLVAIDSSIVRTLLQIDFMQFTPQAFLDRAQEEIDDIQTNVDEIESELRETSVGSTVRQGAGAGAGSGSGIEDQGSPRAITSQEPRTVQKVGRNDPCPCGSGKKYKKCCGAN